MSKPVTEQELAEIKVTLSDRLLIQYAKPLAAEVERLRGLLQELSDWHEGDGHTWRCNRTDGRGWADCKCGKEKLQGQIDAALGKPA